MVGKWSLASGFLNGSEKVAADMKTMVKIRTKVSDDFPNFESRLVASVVPPSWQRISKPSWSHEGWQRRCFGFGMPR